VGEAVKHKGENIVGNNDRKLDLNSREAINRINDIIEEAIDHGGDSGGAYFCNRDGLVKAMRELLAWTGLDNAVGIVCENGGYMRFYIKEDIIG
jgi:hypothetical protein